MRRLEKYLIGLGIFLVIFTLFGFFGLPPILKSILIKQLSQSLHREVAMKEIKTNPYTLSATVRDFMVKDRGSSQTFVSFEELYINLQILSAIRQALIFKEIRLKKPFINLVRHQDQSYNRNIIPRCLQRGTLYGGQGGYPPCQGRGSMPRPRRRASRASEAPCGMRVYYICFLLYISPSN